MRVRRLAFVLLGAAGIALYLWPALRGPVVVWADGQVDMRWAREGTGLWKPLTSEEALRISVHPLKPGYLLYLKLAMWLVPGVTAERSAILIQSLLLWISIAATSFALGRRHGFLTGAAAYASILLFIPLRDCASSVMTEAVSAALFLPIAAAAIGIPRRRSAAIWTAIGLCILFSIRPNVAAIAFLLVVTGWSLSSSFRETITVAALFFVGIAAFWALTRDSAGPDRSRGLFDALLFGSSEYNWGPSLKPWPPPGSNEGGLVSDPRLRAAADNWRQTLSQLPADRDRELRWRAWHGVFGQEYYDARWSPAYRGIDHLLRASAVLLVLAALATSLALRRGRENRAANAAALLATPAFLLHNLAFAPIPRYLLPLLPFVLLLAARAAFLGRSAAFFLRASAFFVAGLALVARYPEVSSWDWGQIEAAGVTLEQSIPLGGLPRPGDVATLHVRVSSPIPSGSAHFELRAGEQIIYRSVEDPNRSRPYITANLPPEVLRRNVAAPIRLRLTSIGTYGPDSWLLFAINPPPWRTGARRVGSKELSPRSDVRFGGLDWWAHSGER